MASKNKGWVVPKEEREEFKAFIQRANRRIKANFRKYVASGDITSIRTERALVGKFADPTNWNSSKTPLSRSITQFESEKDYERFKAHFGKWGDTIEDIDPNTGKVKHTFVASPEMIREGYKKSIIEALNRTLINKNIPTENGQIPADILARIDGMSLEQLANFFGEEVDEELENSAFDSDEVQEGDPDSFRNYINSQISWVQRVYPSKE